ncbi:MAG TPA: SRPBCC domain-containing protein [Vicinamibacterales bacterium]|nr:SRPBCC domain-containing protein [Vicinamibacterales bacterium]
MTEPVITQVRRAFSLTCRVDVNVRAPADRVWTLLTDAGAFPRWNSTVSGIEGEIREGSRLRVHAPGTNMVFTPSVSGVVPNERMTWTGGFSPVFKGVRTFELRPHGDDSSDFTMTERFSGLLLPVVRRWLPDFGPVFARYAGDLKREAER